MDEETQTPFEMSASVNPSNSLKIQYEYWKQLKPVGDIPSLRQGHAVAVLGDKAYLFGGSALNEDGVSIFYNDLFALNLNTSEMKWESVNHTGDIPTPREGHSLNVVGTDIYLCGGIDSDTAHTCVQDLHIFHTDTIVWSKKNVTGAIPQAQSSSSVSTQDGRIVTFGGVLMGKACNDTYILQADTLVWNLAETTGQIPKPRCDHGCAVLDNKMVIFGGSAGECVWLNDLNYLNLETLEWTSLGPFDQAPSLRDYPAVVSINTKGFKNLVLFGGFTSIDETDTCLNDTHAISFKNTVTSWTPITGDEDAVSPPVRYGHTAFVHGSKVFIHGGQDTEKMLSDLWVLEFKFPEITISPTVPPRRNYKPTTPIPAPRRNLPPPPPKEPEPRDFETLRSQCITQINEIVDSLKEKHEELDLMEKTLAAEREQFENEKQELHETYDDQQKELQEVIDHHQKDNEEWVETMKRENDEERRAIAEEKARQEREREELETEKKLFTEKSTKLDAIMRQVKGLTS